jgi:hypothetical protein
VKNNLIVDCKNQFLRNKMGVQIFINNPVLQSKGKTAESFCAPKILNEYGLLPIPYQRIGPKTIHG